MLPHGRFNVILLKFPLEIEKNAYGRTFNTLKAKPGSKGQYGYPYCVNTSLNYVSCHGMPSATRAIHLKSRSKN